MSVPFIVSIIDIRMLESRDFRGRVLVNIRPRRTNKWHNALRNSKQTELTY